MSKVEAFAYLRGRGLGDELASKLYELVGGRVVHLELAAKLSNDLLSTVNDQNKVFEGTCMRSML